MPAANQERGVKKNGKVDFDKIKHEYKIFPVFRYKFDYWLVVSIAAAWSIFQLWTSGFGVLFAVAQRSIHAAFFCALVFLLYPATKKTKLGPRQPSFLFDRIPIILTGLSLFYLLWNLHAISWRAGSPTGSDLIFGAFFLIVILEATRRSIGLALPIIGLLFLGYAYLGRYMPYPLDHRGFDFEAIISHMFITTEGLWGVPAGVSATFVYIFVAFGAFLDITGAGRFFIKLAFSITGRLRGGPAKAAVISSALMGSVSGSAVANVVTTGAFTIPLMKTTGLSPRYAGAVEAAASSGGQIMPPVMGAAAYIMTVYTETPYIRIMLAALIPALLYFFGVLMSVHFETAKKGIGKYQGEDLPKLISVLKEGGQYLLPLGLLIYLLMLDWTPLKAGFYSSMLVLLLGFVRLRKEDRLNFKGVFFALLLAARNAISVAAALICAGVVVGVVSLTGLGLKFAAFIEYLAHGSFFLTLFFTMISSLILGMGLPTSACYVVLAVLAAPILTGLGLPILAAHFFIFYFGVLSAITPPVAIAAYAAAGLAGSKPFKTAFTAMPLALSGFIIPYWMAYDSAILFYGPISQILVATVFAFLAVALMSVFTQGYFMFEVRVWERISLLVIIFIFFVPNIYLRIAGVFLTVVFYLSHRRIRKIVTI